MLNHFGAQHRIEGRQVQLGQLTGIGRGLMEGDGGQSPAGLGDAAGAGVNADGVVAPAEQLLCQCTITNTPLPQPRSSTDGR
jgi:hypothetical protein